MSSFAVVATFLMIAPGVNPARRSPCVVAVAAVNALKRWEGRTAQADALEPIATMGDIRSFQVQQTKNVAQPLTINASV